MVLNGVLIWLSSCNVVRYTSTHLCQIFRFCWRRDMRRALGILVALALLAVAGNAQTFRGAINGTVTDPSGAVVAGASVKATNAGTGIAQTTSTTGDGEFSFQDLPLGTYKIEVSAAGFRPATVDNVSVTAGTAY